MSTTELCTFYRAGEVCGRVEEDETAHVWPNERMQSGLHVWRHDKRTSFVQAWTIDPTIANNDVIYTEDTR